MCQVPHSCLWKLRYPLPCQSRPGSRARVLPKAKRGDLNTQNAFLLAHVVTIVTNCYTSTFWCSHDATGKGVVPHSRHRKQILSGCSGYLTVCKKQPVWRTTEHIYTWTLITMLKLTSSRTHNYNRHCNIRQ